MKKIWLALVLVVGLFLMVSCAPGHHGWGGHWGLFPAGHHLLPHTPHYGPQGHWWR